MRQTSFATMHCPIARTLDKTGEWWSVLILRDALRGFRRFDEFQESLGIPPSSLARRLATLVDEGLLEKHPYSERPLRHEYVLTESGRDFLPVLVAMQEWGFKHTTADGTGLVLTDRRDGHRVDPALIDRATGEEISDARVAIRPAPGSAGASERETPSAAEARNVTAVSRD